MLSLSLSRSLALALALALSLSLTLFSLFYFDSLGLCAQSRSAAAALPLSCNCSNFEAPLKAQDADAVSRWRQDAEVGGAFFKAQPRMCCPLQEEVLALTNEFREKECLPRLELHEALSAVARKHALAMADHCQPFSHDGATERFQDSGLVCHNFAENLAVSKGYAREVMAKATVDGWIASPGHRKNLLGPFNVCGIGWSSNDDCQLYITQLLAYVDLETEPTALSSQVLDAAMQLMDSTPAVCAFTGMALAGPAGLLAGCILGGTARVQWGIRPSSIPLALAARARREVCPARCSLCGASGRLLLSSDRSLLCSSCHPAPEDENVWQYVE